MSEETLDTKKMMLAAAAAATEKKASDLIVLEISAILNIADYFLICSGQNDRQIRAISAAIRVALHELGGSPLRSAGEDKGDWILIDYGDYVIHVLTEEKRAFYQLERLWSDAPVLELPNASDKDRVYAPSSD